MNKRIECRSKMPTWRYKRRLSRFTQIEDADLAAYNCIYGLIVGFYPR